MLSDLKLGMETFLDMTYGGVNFTGPGNNGGSHCRDHVTNEHRAVETIIGIIVSIASGLIGLNWPLSEAILKNNNNNNDVISGVRLKQRYSYSVGRVLLLVIHTFVFGIEVGFKFASRTLIFLLNPCHVSTCVQIYLLATPAGFFKHNVALYRMMLHFLHGTLAALLFPVTECLLQPFEVATYWIQHWLLLIVPFYMLLSNQDSDEEEVTYTVHETLDFGWIFYSFGIWSFWHFVVMQGIAFLTLVNVGSMLCSAPSDPFEGPNYRLIGIIHQFVAVVTMGIFTSIIGRRSKDGASIKVEEKID